MNKRLEKLFEKYDLSSKDRRDFLQIYDLLPSHKKVGVMDNFENMVQNINALRDDLYLEQEILFWRTLENIENYIEKTKKKLVSSDTREAISSLKNMM